MARLSQRSFFEWSMIAFQVLQLPSLSIDPTIPKASPFFNSFSTQKKISIIDYYIFKYQKTQQMKFRHSKPRKNYYSQKTPTFQQSEQLGLSNNQSNKSQASSGNKSSLDKIKLERLIQNKSFICQFQQLNRTAVDKINFGLFLQAETALNQAQQLLQQAFMNRKTSSIAHIVTIFHNQICRYQHSWQLEVCLSYVQAIIYNLKCQTQKIGRLKSLEFTFDELVELRGILANYYLLFCAFNSQLKQHDTALIAAKRSNNLFRQYFKQINNRNITNNTQKKFKECVQQLELFSRRLGIFQKKTLLQITDGLFTLRRNKISHPKQLFCEFLNEFREYSIAKIIQLQPIVDFSIKGDSCFSKNSLLQKIIMFSISYFTMATELRLLAKKSFNQGLQLKQINQYKQSQSYHLIAIIISLYFIPFDLIYLRHLVESFKLHYSIELTQFRPIISSLNCQSYAIISQKIRTGLQNLNDSNQAYIKQVTKNHKGSLSSKLTQKNKYKIIFSKESKSKPFSNSQHLNLLKGKSLSTHSIISLNKKHRNSTSKSKKNEYKYECVTTVQSPNKMSISNTPRRLSPKYNSRYYPQKKQLTQSYWQRLGTDNVKTEVRDQYFDYAGKKKINQNRNSYKIPENQLNKQNQLVTVDINSQRTPIKESANKKKSFKKELMSKRKTQEENFLKSSKSAQHLTKLKIK